MSNRKLLVFLFFVAVSASFWIFLALSDMYERDFAVRLKLTGVPSNVVVTTDLPQTFHVVLKDHGVQLLKYEYAGLPSVNIDFRNYDRQSGHVVVQATDVVKQLRPKLQPTTELVSYKAERLEYYFNNGLNVKLPVVLKASLKAGHLYGISSVALVPDSVTVYAIPEILDTMRAVYTDSLVLSNLSAGKVCKVGLSSVRGAKFVPSSVRVKVGVDQMTEKSVEVPVRMVNFPAGKTLRTFPSRVRVVFQIGMGMYRKVTADDFTIALSYEELLNENGGKVRLYLKSIPSVVSHVRIVPASVDFLIEDVTDDEEE